MLIDTSPVSDFFICAFQIFSCCQKTIRTLRVCSVSTVRNEQSFRFQFSVRFKGTCVIFLKFFVCLHSQTAGILLTKAG